MPTEEHTNGTGLTYLREVFTIDLRSLAVLRILIASIIFYYLALIGSSAPMFYQETGVLPMDLNREAVLQSGGGFWSVLWLSESVNWFWLCVAITGLATTSLMLGFCTTISTVVTLVMVWSFQVRNPLVLTAGDILLRMVLVWGVFLPWGKLWSIDDLWARSKHGTPSVMQLKSFATAAIMLQLAFIYFFSGVAKFNGGWSGTALVQSLNLEMYVRGNWDWLIDQRLLVNGLAIGILIVEIVGPILLFVPKVNQYWRGMMMALMCLMHLGIWLSMSIGVFSIVAIVTWLVFIPGEVWNQLLGRPDPMKRQRKRRTSQSHSKNRVSQYVCAALLVFVVLLNLDKTRFGQFLPNQLNSFATILMIQQEFKMFANPPTASPWPQYVSTLNDGDVVDLFRGNARATDEKPRSVYRYLKSQFWRRYHFNLIDSPLPENETPSIYHRLRKRLLDVQITKWNQRHEKSQRVVSAELLMNFDEFGSDGQPNGSSTRQSWAKATME